jgi:hypothetical protein
MSATQTTKSYLKTFFEEKSLDRNHTFEVTAPLGTVNMIEARVVIDTILTATPAHEQEKIASILRKIDFHNGDVMHFLSHLAGALAYDF